MLDSVFEKIKDIIREELSPFQQNYEENEVEAELILLYHPECPSCKDVLEGLQEAIESGYIRKVNILSVEGKNIAMKLGHFAVPQLIAKIDKEYKPCELQVEGQDLIVDCGIEVKKK